jgi:YegS/Rv2252/BmrU family lipid kinase
MPAHSPSDLKTFVVLNPSAGTLDPNLVRAKIDHLMAEHQIPHRIHETTRGEDLHQVIESARKEGFESFLAVGGDGTVSGVASGLAHTSIPVIVVPTGTSNALAKVFGLPLNLEEAVDWWLTNRGIKTVDAMQVENRYYILNISIGASSQALAEVERQAKRRMGSFAYWIKGLQRLTGLSAYRFRVEIDGQSHHLSASEVIVANSGIAQFEPMRLDPEIRIDDGKWSLCTIRVRTILDYLRVAGKIISGRPQNTPELTCRDAFREINIQTRQPLPIQADGEIIGQTPVTVKLVPGAVDFLVPENPEA